MTLSDIQKIIWETVRDFVRERIVRGSTSVECEGGYLPTIVEEIVQLGLPSMSRMRSPATASAS